MRRSTCKPHTVWPCALALLVTTYGASATPLGEIAAHYSKLNDDSNIGIADITFSIVTRSSPRLLTYLGDDIRYDVTIGQFFDGNDDYVPFVYAGPTWEYHPGFLWSGNYLEIGTAVTYLGHSHVGSRDMGGRFQFTTHATLGQQFGTQQHWRLGLRLQHTSNAGTESPNPGLDAALVELAYRFR